MKTIGLNEFLGISRKTGMKPSHCRCRLCQQQCHTPCLGTPSDISRLIEAGYGDRLKPTIWEAGIVMGITDHPIPMIQARIEGDWCTFFHDGLCELHNKGLKPTEGKLSHHSMTLERWTPKKSLSWNVAKTWEEKENQEIIREIINHYVLDVYVPNK